MDKNREEEKLCQEIVKGGEGEKVLVICFDVLSVKKSKAQKAHTQIKHIGVSKYKELMKMGIFGGVAEG